MAAFSKGHVESEASAACKGLPYKFLRNFFFCVHSQYPIITQGNFSPCILYFKLPSIFSMSNPVNEPRLLRIEDIGYSTFSVNSVDRIRRYSETPNEIEIIIPKNNQRPWNAPPGYVCLYESFFTDSRLWFPLPQLLVSYCARRRMAFSQLTPSSIRNITGLLILSSSCNIQINSRKFEELTNFSANTDREGTFVVRMKPKHQIITGVRSQTRLWFRNYFYVRINQASIYNPDALVFRHWATEIVKPIQLGPFPPNFSEECEALKQAGTLRWGDINSQTIRRTVIWVGRNNQDEVELLAENSTIPSPGMAPKRQLPSSDLQIESSSAKKRKVNEAMAPGPKKPVSQCREDAAIVICEDTSAPSISEVFERHHGFSFEYDGKGLLSRNESKCEELVRKTSGFQHRLPENLREAEVFDKLSRSMIQSIGYIGQSYSQYERRLSKADETVAGLRKENAELKTEIKTIRDEEKSTSERLFEENSRLSSELEDAKRLIRDLTLAKDLNTATLESTSTASFEEGRKKGKAEAVAICQVKLDKAYADMKSFAETFVITSSFGQARAVSDTLHSLHDSGFPIPEEIVKDADEKRHLLQEQAEAASVPDPRKEDFDLSKDPRLVDS